MMWTLKNGDITKKDAYIWLLWNEFYNETKEISHGSQTSYILLKSSKDGGISALI